MPNGIYPVPIFDRHSEPMTLWVRLKTWWRSAHCDRQLVAGTDPASSPELSLRASQLRSPARRIRLASSLEHVVSEAFDQRLGFTTQAPLRSAEVRSCADELFALAHRLRDGRQVDARGVAMAASLLFEGTGPLFTKTEPSALSDAVRAAQYALHSERLPESSQARSAA